MSCSFRVSLAVLACGLCTAHADVTPASGPVGSSIRLQYNHPGAVVDLGVGLWALPLPMDYDGDGDCDMVVATVSKPSRGIFFFENLDGNVKYPTFGAPVRLGDSVDNMTVSHVEGGPFVMGPATLYPEFQERLLEGAVDLGLPTPGPEGKIRARQWSLVDYDGDGNRDVIVGLGVWEDYGWDDAYNEKGEWTNGPLHGYVYVFRNTGTNDAPEYAAAEQVMTSDGLVDTFGAPSPNFADFDGDGDLDLVCGEFLDRLTYFENIGTRTEPKYASGRYLEHEDKTIHLELCMLRVVAMDWDKDGDVDLIVGEEDGRVALVEHTGAVKDGMPVFLPPRHFQQTAANLKVGALATPYACDWDGDGDEDLIVGDTAGFLSFVENLDGGNPPSWAAPVRLEAAGETIRIMAGYNGSIQGPAEAKWGYTVPNVADWNHDGLLDIVINSIWGEVLWYENVGEQGAPRLAAAQPIEVEWEGSTPKPEWVWWTPKGKQLLTQWRTTPLVYDWNGDGLNDLIMLDHEGYLAFFERRNRDGDNVLLPGSRIFRTRDGEPLRLNEGYAGKSGRRKLALTDWDGNGTIDILINGDSVEFMRNTGTLAEPVFENLGSLDARPVGGHSTCPTVVDWDKNGVPDLLYGAEDGFFYYLPNPRPAR